MDWSCDMLIFDVGIRRCTGGGGARFVGDTPIACTGDGMVARALLVAAVGDDGGGVARS